MRAVLYALIAITVLMAAVTAASAKRHHVVIHKPSQQPAQVSVAMIPIVGMFYDLARRTDCRGDVLGAGGPGFDSPLTPATGNVMTTAYMRGECSAQPKGH